MLIFVLYIKYLEAPELCGNSIIYNRENEWKIREGNLSSLGFGDKLKWEINVKKYPWANWGIKYKRKAYVKYFIAELMISRLND